MKFNHSTHRILLAAGVAALVALVGCHGYGSYPQIPTATPQNSDPNAPPAPALMKLGLDYVTSRYPPRTVGAVAVGDPTFAINLPAGTSIERYEKIASQLGDHARPLTRTNALTLPIYHVGRIWVRGNTAKVDILRPIPELGIGPDGQPVYRGITLHCEARLEPWRVIRAIEWEIGTLPVPDLNFIDEPEGADEELEVPVDEGAGEDQPSM